MDPEILLERMASISPSARLQITGHLWRVNIDADEITQQLLMNNCFASVITEAYELGIEFFCTLNDLCQSTYVLDKVLLLFEVVFPSPLYKSIVEDDGFRRFITAVNTEGSSYNGESSIVSILEYLALYNEATRDIFYDTYVFLQDKIHSTPVFDEYVGSILAVDNTPVTVPADETSIQKYMQLIQSQFDRLLSGADSLFRNLPNKGNVVAVYDTIHNYKITTTAQDTLLEFSWAHTVEGEELAIPIAQVLKTKYLMLFRAATPFAEEYFITRNLPVLPEHLYTLVLGAYLVSETKDAFFANVKQVFDRLAAAGRTFDADTKLFIQKLILAMTQEYGT